MAAQTSQTARAVDIEIVERDSAQDVGANGSVLIPNSVRINGQEVLVASDQPITIHEINEDSAVRVTLTLFASSITIRRAPETDR
jgi:hypothetical protein